MARKQSTDIRSTLKRLVPKGRLVQLAQEYGVIVRRRTVNISAFFWTLVLGFTATNELA